MKEMYKKLKAIYIIIAWVIYAVTIDLIDLTDSFILNCLIIPPIIEFIIRNLSYLTCNIIVYRKLNINNSFFGSFGYWISYIIYVLILFGILVALKFIDVIPFVTNLDTKIFTNIVNYIRDIFMKPVNQIVEVLQN